MTSAPAHASAPRAAALSIAEVATATGLSAHTLRYYERDGLLLHPVGRSASGHRSYSPEDLAWIVLVTRLRSTGMSIADVRRYADLVRAGDHTAPQRLELLAEHRAKVEAELVQVTAHLRAIDHKIAIYASYLEPDARHG